MTARFLAGASDGLKQKSRVSRQKKKKNWSHREGRLLAQLWP